MRIIFMGTPDFAVPSLYALAKAGYPPIAVVTGPDRRRGRGQKLQPTAVKKAALELEIGTILQPDSVKDPGFIDTMADLNCDVMVVVAFKILPPAVFTQAKLGAFNLHGSLLPKYRGAAPINRAIMQGDTETGVTTFFLQAKVDTGNMILQKKMTVGPNETAGEVHDRMMFLGAEAVVETVQRIEAGRALETPQDDRLATPAPKLFKEDGRIAWHDSASTIHNHIRGLSPYPGAWTHHDDTLLKIYRSHVVEGNGEPGTIIEKGDRLVIAAGAEAIEIIEIQQQGRRRLKAADFLRGYPIAMGDLLGGKEV